MTPPDEKLRALLERLRAMVDSGRFAPGGGTIDANGKVKTWGGEPIKVPRNLDGPEAADTLETLLSRVATLEAALEQARAEEREQTRMDVIRAYDAAQAECQRIITETKFAEDVTSDQREWFKRGAQACSAMISYVGRQVAFPSDELQALGQEMEKENEL